MADFLCSKNEYCDFSSCEKNIFGRKTCPKVKWSVPKHALLDGDNVSK